ncbi:gamma-glutamyltransferase [Cucurbitaria berberidis CBS 394.84]|uniref:Glutathione hydrolase n=1 Tax=Cucurbitaria berberidis CBS 394.84 TaxID=1168544 RepID=A0A9P4LDH1_9PLEO|nr:gamma-glutamyltransferase [Cucurbitaria berberidis CBS 394.84]KAF1850387.1 gamma-glutamyltransferase [Cucurbitaria berberidis CBS 394.84]
MPYFALQPRDIVLSATILVLAVITVAFYVRLSPQVYNPPQHPTHGPKYGHPGSRGAVASESRICSSVGIEIIREGGNAADAMVGTVFCVGVIGMYHSGIGGGGFALVRSPNSSYDFVDFRETAPSAAFEDMFVGAIESSLHGGNSSAVPGELRGLEYLSKTYGRLPWKRLLQPAIKIAQNGFPVGADLIRYLDYGETDFLVKDPSWSQDFAPNGTRVGAGDYVTRPRYARTLSSIAEQGAEAFYSGDIAELTISAVKRAGGIISMNDLASYSVRIREPLTITYRGFKLTGCEAPASGAVTLSAMKLIEGYDDIGTPSLMNLSTHRIIEAVKFAYGMRPHLGDPIFVNDSRIYQAHMASARTAVHNRAKISDLHTLYASEYDAKGFQTHDDDGTSHIVVADGEGMVITLTTTLNNPWGSYIMVPETGVILNNQMNDFSVPGISNGFGYIPAPANFVRAGKTPLSSMSPIIVEHLSNSSFYFATGSAGGSRIITAVVQILWNVLDRGLDIKSALSTPRWHDQLNPYQTLFEYTYDNATVEFLAHRGHNVTWVAPAYSESEAVRRLANDTFEAVTDPNLVNGAGLVI